MSRKNTDMASPKSEAAEKAEAQGTEPTKAADGEPAEEYDSDDYSYVVAKKRSITCCVTGMKDEGDPICAADIHEDPKVGEAALLEHWEAGNIVEADE